jgi:hypothetical protein
MTGTTDRGITRASIKTDGIKDNYSLCMNGDMGQMRYIGAADEKQADVPRWNLSSIPASIRAFRPLEMSWLQQDAYASDGASSSLSRV